MRKYLFSFVAVLAFTGLFGLQSAFSRNCSTPTESFTCSGGTFYGTQAEINCWLSQLTAFICGGSDCGVSWTFHSTEGDYSFHTYTCPSVE
jgi:hypothetical protein